jgi:hypothetical protein
MDGKSFNGYEHNKLWRNNRDGTFTELGWASGADLIQDTRCCALGDFDRDGRVDIVVRSMFERSRFLLNEGAGGRFLRVRLVGTKSNRMGIGARLTAYAGSDRYLLESTCGDGFLSQHEPGVHFGLGDHARVDRLVIRWPSGLVQELRDLPADRFITVTEGDDAVKSESPRPAPAPPAPAPDRVLKLLREGGFTDLKGNPLKGSTLLKDVTLLHVWNPSVRSSTAEALTLGSLLPLASRGSFGILAVAVGADADAVRVFVREHDLAYPVILATGGTAKALAEEPQSWRSQYRAFGWLEIGEGGAGAVPWSGLLDRSGLIRSYRGPVKAFEAKLDILQALR